MTRRTKFRILQLLVLVHGLSGFAAVGQGNPQLDDHTVERPLPPRQSQEIEIGWYNVENLWDTQHDDGKNDWEFLPKDYPGKVEQCEKETIEAYRRACLEADWTPAKLELKLNQIHRVLNRPEHPMPELLGLAEVENSNVVGMLAKTLNYPHFVMTDSPDERGIDVALLYRDSDLFKFVKSSEIKLVGDDFIKKPTRNILEVEFLMASGQRLVVFVNHWPSQSASSRVRLQVAEQLKARLNQLSSEDPGVTFLAIGDFNTLENERPYPYEPLRDVLLDSHYLFLGSKDVPKEHRGLVSLGTSFYPKDMTWSRLDRIFAHAGLYDGKGLELLPSTYAIYNPKFIRKSFLYTEPGPHLGTRIEGVPLRYDFSATTADGAGFSDHFPLFIRLINK